MSYFEHNLHPPYVPLDADIRWVLLAAFADAGPGDVRPTSPEHAARLIQQFSLVSQVTSRLSATELAEALTPVLQKEISAIARRRLIRSLAVVGVRERVCRAASEAGIDIVLLKQAALEVMGLVTPGRRYATDVDILVNPGDVTRLSEKLSRSGFIRETRKKHAYGVIVLRAAQDIGVELHTKIVDLRLPGLRPEVDFALLKEGGLIGPTAEASPRILVPSLAVVGAHLVAQGWYLFHFVPNAPRHKSPVRIIVDLGLIGTQDREGLALEIYAFVKHEVPADEFFGLVELAGRLAEGKFENSTDRAGMAFRHAFGALLFDEYRHKLSIGRQITAIRREGTVSWASRQFARTFTPSQDDLARRVETGAARNHWVARLQISGEMVMKFARGVWAGLKRKWP